MFGIPANPGDLTPSWLGFVLAGEVAEAHVEQVGQAYGLSSTICRCRLTGRGVPSSVIVKLWASERPVELREVPFYSAFAPRLGVRIPRCHYGAVEGEHAVLVLEDLESATQGDCLNQLDGTGAAVMARTLAALHATWWERPELSTAIWLPPMSVRTQEWLLTRREQYLQRFGDHAPAWVRQLLDRVESLSARAVELLSEAPQTLLHADLHLDNILFEGDVEHSVILDWARVARGPAAIDLVELLFSLAPEWEPALAIYVAEMRRRGIEIDEALLHRTISGALLRRFISATCGISRWEPRSERERAISAVDQQRVFGAVEEWRRRNPEWLPL